MRSLLAHLRMLTLPGGATTGRRIVLDGIRGIIQVYNAAGSLVLQLSNDTGSAILQRSLQLFTSDADEDLPGILGGFITGAGGTRNLGVQLIAPAFNGAADFPFIEILSQSQDGTTDPATITLDTDGPGRLRVSSFTGESTLVAGTVAVARTTILGTERIMLSRRVIGGVPGNLSYVRTAGVGFTINSDNAGDTSTVSWLVLN